MADQIKTLKDDHLQIDLTLIIDHDHIPKSTIYRCFEPLKISTRTLFTNTHAPSENNMQERRHRIANNFNWARQNPNKTDYTLLLEDDTNFQPHYLQKLIDLQDQHPKAGITSAVQAGRHGLHHIGAWTTDNADNPTEYKTLPYSEGTIREVTATGFYFALLKTTTYKQHPITYQQSPVGPDVQYGTKLTAAGHTNYIDDNLPCGHQEQQRTIWPTAECGIVHFKKQNNTWQLQPK